MIRIINNCFRHTETQREYQMVGLGSFIGEPFLIWTAGYSSSLLHIYYELRTTICRRSWDNNYEGAYRRWRTYAAMYGDLVEISSQAEMQTHMPHWSIAIDSEPSYNLPNVHFSQSSEWRGVPAIAWNKITSSQGRITDLDINNPCQIDGSMTVEFLMMDTMLQTGLWDCDEASMEGGHDWGLYWSPLEILKSYWRSHGMWLSCLWCYSIFPGSYKITLWSIYRYLIRNHKLSLGFLYWIYLPDLFTY